MSRGLGPQQVRVLVILLGAHEGVTVAELASKLEVSAHRARLIVHSLERRRALRTTRDHGGAIRAWHEKALANARFDHDHRVFTLSRLGPVVCPHCRRSIEKDDWKTAP